MGHDSSMAGWVWIWVDVIRLEGRAKGTSIVFLVAQESARIGRGRTSDCEGGYQVAQNLRG